MEKQQEYQVDLLLDGKKAALKPFVRDVFYQVVSGLVSTLKSTGEPAEIVVRISRARESGRA